MKLFTNPGRLGAGTYGVAKKAAVPGFQHCCGIVIFGHGTSVVGLGLKHPAGSELPERNAGEPSGLVLCGM